MIFIAIFACMLISFLFSGAETGLLSVNRARLRHYAKAGNAVATTLHVLLKRVDSLLVTLATFSTVFRILALALLYSFFLSKIGILGAAAFMTLGIPLFSLFLVVLPRPLFQRLPLATLVVLARILIVCQTLMKPLFSVLSWLTSPFTMRRTAKGKHTSAQNLAATVEIGRAASHLAKLGKLSPSAAQLIQNILRFREIKILSHLIPLSNIVHVEPNTSITELLQLSQKTDIERIPIMEDHKQLTGMINTFDLSLDDLNSGKCQFLARKMVSIPATTPICTAIRKMRLARATLCTVTEEASGKTLGIVTLESLLQKLFIGKM